MQIHLVIVDDSNIWLNIAEKLARSNPFIASVSTYNDPMDAWIYLQTSKSNVLMTDIEMPMLDGFSFVAMFGRKLQIISSSTREEFAKHIMKLGCSNFLSKPFSKDAFDGAIADIYQKASSTRPKKVVKTFG
ncbi:response regulator [Maribacter algicola]|nr:response regulator [Maribacter algicola]